MSKWNFKTKRDTTVRLGRHCYDCGKPILPNSFVRRFTYEKIEDDKKMYDNKYICEDCEKYWRTKEPQVE